ncbi:MAG: DNA cytosine methyltransferase [Ruminococcus sp.]
MLKLLLGGSPCTYWSIAQSKHRETEPSGLGWELFKNYLIAKDKYNPDYFLYENNYSMDNKIRDEITKQLGVEPIMINSALVSAQSRKRLYWTNIPNVQQPDDKGIMLNDILESGISFRGEKSYCLDANYYRGENTNDCNSQSGQRAQVAEPVCVQEQLHNRCADCNGSNDRRYEARTDNKSGTITTTNRQVAIAQPVCVAQRGRYIESGNRSIKIDGSDTEQYFEARTDGKTNTLTTVLKDNAVAEPVILQNGHVFNSGGCKTNKAPTLTANGDYIHNNKVIEPLRIGTIENNLQNPENDSKQYRVYSPFGKSTTLCAEGGGLGAKSGIYATPLFYPEEMPDISKIYEVRNGNITINGKTYPIKLADGFYIIRLLTVLECKRLQTVPDNYIMPCSKSQNYKMLGNGWTIDVISHILSHIPDIKNKNVEVLSMYDGMSCGHIALDKLGCNVVNYYATEIDKYAIKTTFANYPDTIYLGDAFNVRKDDFKIEPPKVNKQEISAVSGNQLTLF